MVSRVTVLCMCLHVHFWGVKVEGIENCVNWFMFHVLNNVRNGRIGATFKVVTFHQRQCINFIYIIKILYYWYAMKQEILPTKITYWYYHMWT